MEKVAFHPPSIWTLGSNPRASVPCKLECHTFSMTPAGIPSNPLPCYPNVRSRVRCTHSRCTYPCSLAQPARERGRVLRLARHAEVQRAQGAQEEPRLEGAHHVPEVRAVVPQLCDRQIYMRPSARHTRVRQGQPSSGGRRTRVHSREASTRSHVLADLDLVAGKRLEAGVHLPSGSVRRI